MNEDTKTTAWVLEGVDPAWLLTPEGRKKAQEIFDRNADKLQIHDFPGDLPPDYVRLRQEYRDDIGDTQQQCGESSAPQQK
jgi:hypothetical protein